LLLSVLSVLHDRPARTAVIPGLVPGTHFSTCAKQRALGMSSAVLPGTSIFAARWVPGNEPRDDDGACGARATQKTAAPAISFTAEYRPISQHSLRLD
jgi:hypothetical protein